jgi:CDP-diacylglycerol---glycerol-3-phosphate 3-phosphatidyltransferase
MNLPTKLTFSRLFLVLVICILLLVNQSYYSYFLAIFLFILASITDLLDGKIARKQKMVTDLGIFLDPLVDKLMILSLLIVLSIYGVFHVSLILLVLFREISVTSFRDFAAKKDINIPSVMSGKVKSVFQDLSVLAGIISLAFLDLGQLQIYDFLHILANALLGLAIVIGYYGLFFMIKTKGRSVIE